MDKELIDVCGIYSNDSGCTGLGYDDKDFILDDEIVEKAVELAPIQDRIIIEYNQRKEPRTKACTIMSTLSVISTLFNEKLSEENQDKCIEYCSTVGGYVVMHGWDTQKGVKYGSKYWNAIHSPEMQVVTFKTTVYSEVFDKIMKKNYGSVLTQKINNDYIMDYVSDGIVDGTVFTPTTINHAISGYYPTRQGSTLMHSNTYAGTPHNQFDVRDFFSLVKNGNYYPSAYVVLPDPGNKLYNYKKNQMDQFQELLKRGLENGFSNGERLKDMATREEVVVMLQKQQDDTVKKVLEQIKK